MGSTSSAGTLPHSLLLADTEIPEDHVQNILDVDTAEQLAECSGREPQLLRHDLLAPVLRPPLRAAQCDDRLLEPCALALARDHRRLGREGALGKACQLVNQFVYPLPCCAR